MSVDLAGLTIEAMFGPQTDVVSDVLPYETVSEQLDCGTNARVRNPWKWLKVFRRCACGTSCPGLPVDTSQWVRVSEPCSGMDWKRNESLDMTSVKSGSDV
nr:hypothetical protein HmN_001015200 [Hymenolepis microstoma]